MDEEIREHLRSELTSQLREELSLSIRRELEASALTEADILLEHHREIDCVLEAYHGYYDLNDTIALDVRLMFWQVR